MLEQLLQHRVVIIFRGQTPEQCLELTRVLAPAGLRYFEVTMNSPNALESIRLLRERAGGEVRVGAGTVTKLAEVEQVQAAGAEYVVSPHTNLAIIERTKKLGMMSIPGAFTPTEVLAAYDAGADLIKVFPIRSVGPDYIRQLRGPIPHIPFMTTGGVTLEMVRPLREAGADAVGVGVALLIGDANLQDPGSREAVVARATELVEAAK
jgi:2-dehydro-3-deoxyphosphogluconate aldolase/(4S)-4-hydroxy-2-oxoglutarate aldolase